MGQSVEITRTEHSGSELRALAAKMSDGAVVRRLLALALVLEGHSRDAAATSNGMTRQTLRDWVHRYNADGVAGLCSRAGGGPALLLSAPEMEELRVIVIQGPDPERHRVVRWRRIDLCGEVARRWPARVCEQTVGKWLRQLRMTRLQPRPIHPKKDIEAAFKKTSLSWRRKLCPRRRRARPSRSGSRTKPGSDNKVRWNTSGRRSVHVRARCAITVMTPPICLARCARIGRRVPRSSCRRPIPRR